MADIVHPDIDSLRPTSDRRKAGEVRILPSICRGSSFHDMRSPQQDPIICLLQSNTILHDTSPTNPWSVLYFLPLLLHLHSGYVNGVQNDWGSFPKSRTGHGSGGSLHSCPGHLHRLRCANPRHASLVPVDQLPRSSGIRLRELDDQRGSCF